MESPDTQYVTVGNGDVAYQVLGEGDNDLLYCYGLGSHLELLWDLPEGTEYLRRLASFSRLVLFDRRGTGASDGIARDAIPTWEEWTDDLMAVLDAAGSAHAAVLASLDAGLIAIMFAAMHPERVSALILLNTAARYCWAEDYAIGLQPDAINAMVQMIAEGWGTNDVTRIANPSVLDDLDLTRRISRMIRSSATPKTAAAQYAVTLRSDLRQVLPLVQLPTLVMHSTDNPLIPPSFGRYLAEHIKGAQFVELPGGDLGMMPIMYRVSDEIAEFLTGVRPVDEVERILTTVLFTDIVGSTERAVALGDQRWRSVLDAHDRVVRDHLRMFRGREVKTTGDGFLATFDGPARAIRCADGISAATDAMGLSVRLGLHSGECEVRGDDLGGLAVHIAARIGAIAGAGEILVSGTVKDLVVGSGIDFDERGEHDLKGVPGTWKLFAVRT
jgi:class 3 adenylate cyclase/pimeloyl-ACP methyl ester carboxylesterase